MVSHETGGRNWELGHVVLLFVGGGKDFLLWNFFVCVC